MIDIIGLIKIDESQPDRIQSLVACIRSYRFLDPYCKFILALENPSTKLYNLVLSEVKSFTYGTVVNITHRHHEENSFDYGRMYSELIDKGRNDYIINFMEDQFMVIDNAKELQHMLETMKYYGVDVCKCGFFKIEHNSCKGMKFLAQNHYAKIFENNQENHFHYNKHYGKRFYIGVNFITSKKFAKEFWNRSMGFRPHEYEVGDYSDQWKHICMIPKIEIQAAVNDDHGEPGTCMLKRQEKKWLQIMDEIAKEEPDTKAEHQVQPLIKVDKLIIPEENKFGKIIHESEDIIRIDFERFSVRLAPRMITYIIGNASIPLPFNFTITWKDENIKIDYIDRFGSEMKFSHFPPSDLQGMFVFIANGYNIITKVKYSPEHPRIFNMATIEWNNEFETFPEIPVQA